MAKKVLKLSADEFIEIVREDNASWVEVGYEIVGQNRWSNTIVAIFHNTDFDKYYEFCYERPTTEMGSLSDHVYGEQTVKEVMKKEVVTHVWVPVEE